MDKKREGKEGGGGEEAGNKMLPQKKKKNFNTYPHWSISLISSELVKSKKKI